MDVSRAARAEELLAELYEWAIDACHQGSGHPITEPCWHSFISTWEEADDFLPVVAEFLGRPDPHKCDHDWRVFVAAASYKKGGMLERLPPTPDWCAKCGLKRPRTAPWPQYRPS